MSVPLYHKVEKKDAPLIGLRLSSALYTRVQEEAKREGIPVAEVVRGVLRAWASANPAEASRK